MKKNKALSSIILSCILLLLANCKSYYHVFKSHQAYNISSTLPIDTSIVALYAPYKANIDSQMNVVVGYALTEIKRSKPEGRLNNLAADGISQIAKNHGIKFDLLHLNYKALRVPIPAGSIKTYKIFEFLPFENTLVTMKLKGDDVKELFNYIAKLGGDAISGASFKILNKQAVDIKINGKALDPTISYTILTNDFLANGGDGAQFYTTALERHDTSLKQRDIFFEYLKKELQSSRVLDPKLDGRITSDIILDNE